MRSVFRVGWPATDRARAMAMLSSFFLHVHAPRVRVHSVRASYTFGLGLLSAYLFGLLTLTGVLLMLYYTPSPALGYRSIKDLQFVVPFGAPLRNLHRWAGHAMVVVVLLHTSRVFFTGAYKDPRQFNWVIGVGLLVLTLALSFTGYLLPWDQLAFWAITVGTSMVSYIPVLGGPLRHLLLAGDTVGAGALLRFYVLHCAVLPVTMLLLVCLHVFRVRRDGLSWPGDARGGVPGVQSRTEARSGAGRQLPAQGRTEVLPHGAPDVLSHGAPDVLPHGATDVLPHSARSGAGLQPCVQDVTQVRLHDDDDRQVASWPHLLYREVLLLLATLVVLGLFALAVNAPLEEIADATRTPNPARAPWYFLALQELVHHSALVGGVVVPIGLLLALLVLPYLDAGRTGVGVWFARERRMANGVFAAVVIGAIVLTAIGAWFRGPQWAWTWPWVSP